jgi:hypothetical protein
MNPLKKLLKSVFKKVTYGPRSPIGPPMTRGGEGLQCHALVWGSYWLYLLRSDLGKTQNRHFLGWVPLKSLPKTTPWFLTTGFDIERPIRIWLKFGRKLFAAEENDDKKWPWKKNELNVLFHTIKNIFSNFFFLFLLLN